MCIAVSSPVVQCEAPLPQSLHEEQEKCHRLEEDHSRVLSELEKYKERVSELSRRFEDATRAYEQEKRVSGAAVLHCATHCSL